MIYFTSDRHLSHKNVLVFDKNRGDKFIKYDNIWHLRNMWLSWASTPEQEALDRDPYREVMKDAIKRHDDYIIWELMKLSESDEVYFLWDLFFLNWTKEIEAMRDRLKQVKAKMYWTIWNHDDKKHIDILWECFERVKDYCEIRVWENKFVLMHYPIASWNWVHKWVYHLFWHSHQNLNRKIKHSKISRYILKLFWLLHILEPKNRLDVSYDWNKLLRSLKDILSTLKK